jgi:hypothetical protein
MIADLLHEIIYTVTKCLKGEIAEPEQAATARQWLSNYNCTATNTNTTIQELLQVVFFVWSVPWLHSKNQQDQCMGTRQHSRKWSEVKWSEVKWSEVKWNEKCFLSYSEKNSKLSWQMRNEVEWSDLAVKHSLCYWISNKPRKASDFQTTTASQMWR